MLCAVTTISSVAMPGGGGGGSCARAAPIQAGASRTANAGAHSLTALRRIGSKVADAAKCTGTDSIGMRSIPAAGTLPGRRFSQAISGDGRGASAEEEIGRRRQPQFGYFDGRRGDGFARQRQQDG